MGRAALDLLPWVFVAWIGAVQLMHWARDVVPASAWFEVIGVTVSDTRAGQPVRMNVSRIIHAPFTASWVATVRRMTDNGLEFACSSFGTNDYRLESTLPEPLTLDWWTYPVRCDLKPGRYRLDTLWTLDLPGYPPKTVGAQSNVFEIRA